MQVFFDCQFGDAVRTYGIGGMVFFSMHGFGNAIDRATRRHEHDFLDTQSYSMSQQPQRAQNICFYIEQRICVGGLRQCRRDEVITDITSFQSLAHICLARGIAIKPFDLAYDRGLAQWGQVRAVEHSHGLPGGHQRIDQVGTNKALTAKDEALLRGGFCHLLKEGF